MAAHLVALALDAAAPAELARFWAGLLGRKACEQAEGVLLPGDRTQVSLLVVPGRAARVGPDRVHLHLTSADEDDQPRTVAAALRLGGRHLDVGQRPEEGHVVLPDPEGNAFCVIEAGNRFLAGCGLLGELACDGSRDVGVFWSRALGWPLVWDQDEETAIQSPHGGTKIAWGGPPLHPRTGADRQRFVLAPGAGDQQGEVERLVSLGATRLAVAHDGPVALADPDGTPFTLLPR